MKRILLLLIFTCTILLISAQKVVPVQVTAIYPFGTNGADIECVNHLSLNVLLGINNGVNGVELGGFINVNKLSVNGLQLAGAVNFNGQNTHGLQVAGFGNYSGNIKGAQVALFMDVADTVDNAIQLTGFMGISENLRGVQVSGFMNSVNNAQGGQIAGFFNSAETMRGFQMAYLINSVEQMQGAQLAGIMNVAGKVNGVQLSGFINIADSCNNQIGLINLSKGNYQKVRIWTDENVIANVAFVSGGQHFYGLIGVAFGNDVDFCKGTHLGLGYRLPLISKTSLNVEWLNSIYSQSPKEWSNKIYINTSLKGLIAYKIFNNIDILAGSSLNYSMNNSFEGKDFIGSKSLWKSFYLWHNANCGFTLGVQYKIE